MILRPRQTSFSNACVNALRTRGNTLGIAPTGAGKTVMLSSIAGRLGGTGLVLQHRDELVTQNERTFKRVNPGVPTSFFTADYKRWGGDDSVTFSMIQTLVRNLDTMPGFDFIAVDEAHHIAANSYIQVIETARKRNPKVKLLGVTATPSRGDTRNLRAAFDNVADQIQLAELIRDGLLVMPRCFVVDVGKRDELAGVRKTATDFDMGEVEAIMNSRPINDRIVAEWRAKAGDRQTVAFCSTVAHAMDLCESFKIAGIDARVLHGNLSTGERRAMLEDFDARRFPVILNVAVLTEGWDCQPVSCVLLVRPCSHKSTMIQMIGRGLRLLDPERYPGVVKDDCIVMDFGYSLLTHKDLEQTLHLECEDGPKSCPDCDAILPSEVRECAICGFEFPWVTEEEAEDEPATEGSAPREVETLHDFVMTEIELIAKSPFRWESFFDDRVVVANGLDAWATVVNFRGRWVAVGGSREVGMRVVADRSDRLVAMASADDFMRDYGDAKTARKSKSWLKSQPTDKQLGYLGVDRMAAVGMNRYRASCAVTWKSMERGIKNKLLRLTPPQGAMA